MTYRLVDLRFYEPFHELYALKQYINSVESQLPDLIKREEKRYTDRAKESDESDKELINQEFYDFIEVALPKYFWSAILASLWAIFESAITEIAEEVKKQRKQVIKLNDINGDFLERTNKYFNHIITTPLSTENSSWEHLRKFYTLRNAIVHANGQVANIKNEKKIDKIKTWANENIGIRIVDGNLIFTPEFVRKTHSVVFEVIKNLTKHVMAKYPIHYE